MWKRFHINVFSFAKNAYPSCFSVGKTYENAHPRSARGGLKLRPEDYLLKLAQTEAGKKFDLPPGITYLPKPGVCHPRVKRIDFLSKGRKLQDILNLDVIAEKSPDQIRQIWHEFHKNQDYLAGVISSTVYTCIEGRSLKYPLFLLPLPRRDSYEFVVTLFDKNEVKFIRLCDYHRSKEDAPAVLNLAYFTEIASSKGIVPMRGTYDNGVLSVLEAQCLSHSFLFYYGEENPKKTQLLETFTFTPELFNHNDLIAETTESVSSQNIRFD